MSIPQTTLSNNKEELIYGEKLIHKEWFGQVHAF